MQERGKDCGWGGGLDGGGRNIGKQGKIVEGMGGGSGDET